MNEQTFFTCSSKRDDFLDVLNHKEIKDVTAIYLKKSCTPAFNRPRSCNGYIAVITFYNALIYNVIKDFLELGLCKKVVQENGKPLDEKSIERFFSRNSAKIIFETNSGKKYVLSVEDIKYGIYKRLILHHFVDFSGNPCPIIIDKYFCTDSILGAFIYNTNRIQSLDMTFAYEFDWGRIDKDFPSLLKKWESV